MARVGIARVSVARVSVAKASVAIASVAAILVGCTPVPVEPDEVRAEREEPRRSSGPAPERRFAFTTLEGKLVTHKTFRGRMTVIALVTTYDTASQAQTRFLTSVAHRHTPRTNALLLVLEPATHLPLVQAYASSLGVDYPVAFADGATVAGEGAFDGLHTVPSVVILDKRGREVWRKVGLVNAKELSEALHEFDGGPR
jgi:hypothetical protein